MTAPAQPAARPPMPDRVFGALADDVAAACNRHGVPAWGEDGTPADPWADPDEQEPLP